ncbi:MULTISPECIES: DUF305 domain-containing protein [unclassified Arthrobacter]|uniref:DUF305 domain-containing protein n=1 Tax=unclassified Arthrobacter TaxID=235627 RepID=UPI001CFFFE2C|nr:MULTISPECIES: DUF305 domain-containing protein [unclassified Arthrobacter]MCB5283397.1 hypothetical protein [Arthrobacter sp. ES1]WGZ80795.1 DUF305 domain-containing protein [Arthrobacter sp. EM1]
MKKTLTISALGLASVIALAGCAGTSGSSPASSMPGTGQTGMGMSTSSAPAAADHNTADTMFTQGMIPHHAQAVEMSDMMLKKQGMDARITALATRIKAAQAPEIEQMTGWLKSWNEPAQMAPGHGMGDGMMGDDDLNKLDTAQGTEAAKLFLTGMIAHHQGAVTMAQTEISQGKNPDAIELSKAIVTSQTAEIKEMQDLLATL